MATTTASRRTAKARRTTSKSVDRPIGALARFGSWFVQRALGPIIGVLVLLLIWQSLRSVFGIQKFLIASPIETWQALVTNWDVLMRASAVTIQEALTGFGLSIVFGVILGIAVSSFRIVERVIYPLIIGTQGFPKVALAPILVVWVGFGFSSKVIMALLTAFFPILIATIVGLNSNSRDSALLSTSMGLTRTQSLIKIQLPGALPSIFGGIKVASSLSLVGAVVGEFVASSDGLGYRLTAAMSTVNTGILFAALILLAVIGLLLYGITSLIEHYAVPWRRKQPQ